jgi:hypothetical protein
MSYAQQHDFLLQDPNIVFKMGRTTGRTAGRLNGSLAETRVYNGGHLVVQSTEEVIVPAGVDRVAMSGDSGALVYTGSGPHSMIWGGTVPKCAANGQGSFTDLGVVFATPLDAVVEDIAARLTEKYGGTGRTVKVDIICGGRHSQGGLNSDGACIIEAAWTLKVWRLGA